MELTRAQFLSIVAGAAAGAVASAAAQKGPRMISRTIPSSGVAVPVIGVGTWRGFDVGADSTKRQQLADVLRALFEAGGRVIDSSPMYGTSEEVAGDLLTALRAHDAAFVATKVWTEGRDAGIAQMEASMRKLQHPRLELMQIHNLVDWRTHLGTLRAWKKEGRIAHLGITHYRDDAHEALEAVMAAEVIDSVQLNYSIDNRAAERRLLPLAADRGIAVLVNLPFGGGGLLRKVQGKPLPGWAAEIGCRTWAQVLLKYVVAHPAVTCVIPGTSRPEHMRENAGAGSGPLPDDALRRRMVSALA
ncbi:aldo/keto reductase [Luteitalea sp. TBR-22]|uniref:aldo/keto reductase n=1 Tax=Luteitalea sp. TBR-22 TaxID=2802971 RepID=UPI001AF55E87|nr:aldo/keto reductase [Luteitalea sp. TBR-22]BCS35370.1 aldo/keto reductase [Luteitalea sp. TBR-22]